MLFDSHCHISGSEYDENREDIISSLLQSDVKKVTDIAVDYNSSLRTVEFAKTHDFAYAAVGWFPGEVDRLNEELLAKTLKLCSEPKVAAIGEIGLDYHYDDNPDREVQKHWFLRQLEEALRLDMPVCIHSRDADEDTFNILRDSSLLEKGRVLMHCYSSSAEMAKQYIKLGAYISLAGPVTYKNARKQVETAAIVPSDRLLVETDAPYLTPVPKRGEQNRPSYVEYTARRIAEIRGEDYETLANNCYENACRFYRVK